MISVSILDNKMLSIMENPDSALEFPFERIRTNLTMFSKSKVLLQ